MRSCMARHLLLSVVLPLAMGIEQTIASAEVPLRFLNDQQGEESCQQGCIPKEGGSALEYYDNCESMELGYVFFEQDQDMWCYSQELEKNICCGEAHECCQPKWGTAATVSGGILALAILLCLLCCLVQWLCCGPSRRSRRRRRNKDQENESQEQQPEQPQQLQIDDNKDGINRYDE